ncbi:MAG: TlpA disulfide reductase family protein [Acidobacteriota bacterium]|nr:TlpA disulfide reductase family protein [Acidobacteriota bacterium]
MKMPLEKMPLDQKGTEDETRTILLCLAVIFGMVIALSLYIIVQGESSSMPTTQSAMSFQKSQPSLKPRNIATAQTTAAPDFRLKDVAGKDLTLSDYKGKVVVVNFWATWCGPCKMETPWLVELREQYHQKGFEIIGVSVDSLDEYDPADVSAFIKEYKVRYPIVMATKEVVDDFGPVTGLPTTLLIDRQGKVQYRHRGLISFDDLKEKVVKLL